jgi:hypothetical protein
MRTRGLHVILGEGERERLLAASGEEEVWTRVLALAGLKDSARHVDSGPYWDAIHRSLSNGTLFYDEGEYPLNRAVLGGRQLVEGGAHAAVLIEPAEVKDVAAALKALPESRFQERYRRIDPDEYEGEHGDEDCRFAWGKLQGLRRLFDRAAAEGAALLFGVEGREEALGEEE